MFLLFYTSFLQKTSKPFANISQEGRWGLVLLLHRYIKQKAVQEWQGLRKAVQSVGVGRGPGALPGPPGPAPPWGAQGYPQLDPHQPLSCWPHDNLRVPGSVRSWAFSQLCLLASVRIFGMRIPWHLSCKQRLGAATPRCLQVSWRTEVSEQLALRQAQCPRYLLLLV